MLTFINMQKEQVVLYYLLCLRILITEYLCLAFPLFYILIIAKLVDSFISTVLVLWHALYPAYKFQCKSLLFKCFGVGERGGYTSQTFTEIVWLSQGPTENILKNSRKNWRRWQNIPILIEAWLETTDLSVRSNICVYKTDRKIFLIWILVLENISVV